MLMVSLVNVFDFMRSEAAEQQASTTFSASTVFTVLPSSW
jgi:hypothetical protein